jgi:hypothetical protein
VHRPNETIDNNRTVRSLRGSADGVARASIDPTVIETEIVGFEGRDKTIEDECGAK